MEETVPDYDKRASLNIVGRRELMRKRQATVDVVPNRHSDFSAYSQTKTEASHSKPSTLLINESPERNFRKSLLRLETLSAKPKSMGGIFFNTLLRKDSLDSPYSSSNLSRDDTPEDSPHLQPRDSKTQNLISTFAMKHKNNRPSTLSSMGQAHQTVQTEQSDDKYFFRIKTVQSNSTVNLHHFQTTRQTDVSYEKPLGTTPYFLTTHDGTLTSRSKTKKFYSTLKKQIILKEETVINKPVAATISLQNLGIKAKLQHLITANETSGRLTMTMRNLHEFLELIQNIAQLMKASLDTFRLLQSSVEEASAIAQLLAKHPTRDAIVKICEWVHSSRCYELNLKELTETCDLGEIDSLSERPSKPFDEVQMHYLVMFLISYIQDFEKLLNISKQKITQEVSIREKDVIPRTIRQADVICQCISEMLIDDFRSKKAYLVTECKDLISGFQYTNQALRDSYAKVRANIEESLDIFKMMYHKVKNYEKKDREDYFEKQKTLKTNVETLKTQIKTLDKMLCDMQSVEQNVKVFNSKFTEGIETLKKILSFKLKVENVETLFQMPQIEKKLSEYLDLLSTYFIRSIPPEDDQIVAVHTDLVKLPPIKNSFSLFVSYFQDLLKSQIYHELFHESFNQLKVIDDNVRDLYSKVDEQFETFVKSYFSHLTHLAAKHKRAMKNEYWKILTWSDFSNDQALETSISKVANSVKVIKSSLAKSKLIRVHNYKDVIEKNETLEENMKIWNEEVDFAENLLQYLDKITTEILKPLLRFNSEYEDSKPIKARFDEVLLSYIRLRNSQAFLKLCKGVTNYIRGKQHDERQDFLRDFEDSLLRYHLEIFFKSFFKKLHVEFKRYFTNMLVAISSSKFEKFKQFITSCIEVLASLCEQPSIQRLPQLCNLFQRRQEDLQLVTYMMEQILLINAEKPKTLTSEDEAHIRSAPQSTLFKYLLESIHSYDALHGRLNVTIRANELESQMQKLEDQVTKNDFPKEEIEVRLSHLETRAKNSLEEVQRRIPNETERVTSKKKETSSVKTMITDILNRINKLRRKLVKMAIQKQRNQLTLLEEECKKIINSSIQNRTDCYDIKVYKQAIDAIREKVEDFKRSREAFEDGEVIEEIMEDLEGNLSTLEFIGTTGEKLELLITGKLESLEQIKICADELKVIKDVLAEKLARVEFLNAEMRSCTQEQFRNVEIIEDYLSNAYEGICQIDIEVFNNEQLYDEIRLTLSECFEIHFLTHPAFKDKIYSPDLETIKSEIELIRGGIENLRQLIRLDNMALDDTVVFSYEQASTLEGWLQEDLLALFADLVVITRLHGFLLSTSNSLSNSITAGTPINTTEAYEKLQQAKELYSTLQEHEDMLHKNLQKIDSTHVLKGKLNFIEYQLGLIDIIIEVARISSELARLRDIQIQFDMINDRKSIAGVRKTCQQDLKNRLDFYYKEVKKKDKSFINMEEALSISETEATFEFFAHEIELELRRGSTHIVGTLEDEFFFKLNPEKLGAKESLKDSQKFAKMLLREMRSVLRRKSVFETNIGAKFQVDMVFSVVYKTAQGNLIAVLDIVSAGPMNVKGIVISIMKDGKY